MVGFGPVDNRINTPAVSQQQPVGDTKQAGKNKNVFSKIGAFFQQTVFGRFGAKAGRHSALGLLFKIGQANASGKKVVTGTAESPVHTHTFNELTPEKAREFSASANGCRTAGGEAPEETGLDDPGNSFGRLLNPHDPIRKAMNEKLDGIPAELLEQMPVAVLKNILEPINQAVRQKLDDLAFRDELDEMTPQELKQALNDVLKRTIPLDDIALDVLAGLSDGERKLFTDIKAICSKEAYISPNGVIVDPKSGLRAAITKDPDHPEKYIVSFAGTGATETGDPSKMVLTQNVANVTQYLGFVPHLYSQAKDLVAAVGDLCGRENLSTAGHSLGGGMAQYAALYNGVKGKCFNGSPLGFGLQKSLGDKINDAGKLIEHVSMRGDWLSYSGAPLASGISKGEFTEFSGPDTRPRKMSKLADFLGIRTRGNFGEKYYLNYSKQHHEQRLGKLLEKWGVDPNDEKSKSFIEKRTDGAQTDTIWRHCNILPQVLDFAKTN